MKLAVLLICDLAGTYERHAIKGLNQLFIKDLVKKALGDFKFITLLFVHHTING